MKLRHKFVINKIAGENVAVPLCQDGERFDGYIKLNRTGELIFRLLEKDTTEQELFAALKAEFPDGDAGEIRENIDYFLSRLKSADLLI